MINQNLVLAPAKNSACMCWDQCQCQKMSGSRSASQSRQVVDMFHASEHFSAFSGFITSKGLDCSLILSEQFCSWQMLGKL